MHKLICHKTLKRYQSFWVFCQQGKKKVVCQHSLKGFPFTDRKEPPMFCNADTGLLYCSWTPCCLSVYCLTNPNTTLNIIFYDKPPMNSFKHFAFRVSMILSFPQRGCWRDTARGRGFQKFSAWVVEVGEASQCPPCADGACPRHTTWSLTTLQLGQGMTRPQLSWKPSSTHLHPQCIPHHQKPSAPADMQPRSTCTHDTLPITCSPPACTAEHCLMFAYNSTPANFSALRHVLSKSELLPNVSFLRYSPSACRSYIKLLIVTY